MKISNSTGFEERSSDCVNLLISILVRFPQIGTVRIDSRKQLLWMNFMLSQELTAEQIADFQTNLSNCMQTYHSLFERQPTFVRIKNSQPHEKLWLFSIGRDLSSLSRGELSLIITLLSERFSGSLILDDPDLAMNFSDEFEFPEELIDSILENVRLQRVSKNLTAVRENGRVLVFSK